MIIKNIDIANLKEQIRFNKYCIEKYGCSFSDLSDSERKKVIKEIKNKVVKE